MPKDLSSPHFLVMGPQGPRTLQNSVDYCTRCNACVQSCPSYLLKREETFSARGRNQIIRLLLEQKIKLNQNPSLLQQTAFSCILCARCVRACAGALPVPDHVLALRRTLGKNSLPFLLQMLVRLYGTHPTLFACMVRLFQILRKSGAIHILRWLGVLQMPGLRWVKHADYILPSTNKAFQKQLKKLKTLPEPDRADILYLPSLEAQYADPQIACRTLQLTAGKQVAVFWNQASGLFEYLYGNETRLMTQAKNLLTRWEKKSARRKLPLLTDSLEVYLFLKQYPLLFSALPGWQKRAQNFASHIKYITDLSFRPAAAHEEEPLTCALDTSSVLYPAGATAERARKILKTLFGKNFVECEYSRFSIPAGGVAFAYGTSAEEMILENVKDVARRQLRQVFCLSGWAALELDAALRRHYPQAQARHMVYLFRDDERI